MSCQPREVRICAKTFVPANFKRHIIACHVEVVRRLGTLPDNTDNADAPSTSKRPKPSPSKITIQHDRKSALKGSMMYVTENNLPLCFPHWKSSQLSAAMEGLRVARHQQYNAQPGVTCCGNHATYYEREVPEPASGPQNRFGNTARAVVFCHKRFARRRGRRSSNLSSW